MWLVRVRHFRHTGGWIGRVHVISRPLTDYLRYEFAVYCRNVEAGEDVRILDLTDRPDPGLPAQDFWIFDETAVVRMDYDLDGIQLGRELLEDTDPAPYVTCATQVRHFPPALITGLLQMPEYMRAAMSRVD